MDHPDATSMSAQTQVNGPMHITDEEAEEMARTGQQTHSLPRTCRVCKAQPMPFAQDDSERCWPQCVNTGSMPCCKRTSVHFLTFPLFSSTSTPISPPTLTPVHMYTPLLSVPSLASRCQPLNADDSQTSKTSTHKLVDYYCCRHPTLCKGNPNSLSEQLSLKI
jgi:hypothetical protein